MKYQLFLTSDNGHFQEFVRLIVLQKKKITSNHIDFFFLKPKFCLIGLELSSIKVLAQIIEICWKLECVKSMQVIWEHINEDAKTTVVATLTEKLPILRVLLAFSTTLFRARYLLNRIQAKDIGASLIAVQCGPIDQQTKNVSILASFILSSDANCDTKKYFEGSSPGNTTFEPLNCLVENLSWKCKRNPRKKAVKYLAVFIEAGANVLGLNNQAGGNITSPLIVATELALCTGKP